MERWQYPGTKPNWETNYKCYITKNGRWKKIEEDEKDAWGKSLFLVYPKSPDNHCPTFADQNNFMSGLLEVEWRNDNFVFTDGSTRCSKFNKPITFHFKNRLRLFQQVLDFYKTKYNGQARLSLYTVNEGEDE